jgi:hypothetical protein
MSSGPRSPSSPRIPEAVTFGFAVQQIVREGDNWILHGAAPSSDIAFLTRSDGSSRGDSAHQAVFETGDTECLLAMEPLSVK